MELNQRNKIIPMQACWRGIKYMSKAMGVFLVVVLLGYCYVNWNSNFHVVEPGVVFRSAQINGDALRSVIAAHKIKTILNLRGRREDHGWYKDEIDIARDLDVTHLDYGISATASLSVDQMQEILQLIKNAPKPVLVHCKAGADRTGLAAALYLYERGFGEDAARGQLSIRFGHVPIPVWDDTSVMDESLDRFFQRRRTP